MSTSLRAAPVRAVAPSVYRVNERPPRVTAGRTGEYRFPAVETVAALQLHNDLRELAQQENPIRRHRGVQIGSSSTHDDGGAGVPGRLQRQLSHAIRSRGAVAIREALASLFPTRLAAAGPTGRHRGAERQAGRPGAGVVHAQMVSSRATHRVAELRQGNRRRAAQPLPPHRVSGSIQADPCGSLW